MECVFKGLLIGMLIVISVILYHIETGIDQISDNGVTVAEVRNYGI